MASTVDARGFSCPQPVIMTRNALKKGELPVQVLVETVTSRDNVRRAAQRAGFTVRVEDVGEEFKLTISK